MCRLRPLGYGARSKLNKAVQVVVLTLVTMGTAQAETIKVVALGDSLTAGYGLPQGDGFVPQLQAWLTEEGVDAEIVNAGVSGDTTAGGLARLDWSLDPDVDAMIVALGGNDLLRGIPPESSRENLEAILTQVSGARGLPVLLIGLEAPGNYGPDYKAAFDGMYPALATQFDALLEQNFLAPLVIDGDLAAARARFMQADGIHPNKEGVAQIVAAFGPRVAELVARAEP
ncbi:MULTISPECIES: arylesterase [Jannaschia]|uniref:arylesterase n=1 Tax=Jannaschia TaxID=188905 RepID=UPI001C7D289B|nr:MULTISPECIES: arylesterase [unclassified Jannaschia]